MGIHGLWQVLEPTGRPVNINSLRGKVLAIDVSIWLHQLVKGFRDKDGNPLPNAHLLGVFHRVCKLLNYGVKPVFVFDGGIPALKRQTLAGRRQRKIESLEKAEDSRQKILSAYLRQQLQRNAKIALPPALRMEKKISALEKKSPKKKGPEGSQDDEVDDLEAFRAALAAKMDDDVDEVNAKEEEYEEEEEDDAGYRYGVDYSENFGMIQAPEFDTLPLETQHEILFEMQESRKMNSWGKFDKMPKDLRDFSSYQMDRLVKRRALQKKIQSVQQEMGQRHIQVQNLDDLLKMDYNNFDDKPTEIKGSKDDGYVLIKSQTPMKKEKNDPKPGSSKGTEPPVITIDDFIDDSSGEEENVVEKVENVKVEGKIREDAEDADIKLAIERSLKETSVHFESPAKVIDDFIEDSSSDEENVVQKAGKVEPVVETRDSEEDADLKLAIELSLKESLGEFETPKMAEKGEDKAVEGLLPLNIHTSEMSHCAKFLDTVGFHFPSSFPVQKSTTKDCEGNNEARIINKEKIRDSSSESESEDDEFEEVEEPLAEQQPPPPVVTIDIAAIASGVVSQEEDIFADVFLESSERQEESEAPQVTTTPPSEWNEESDIEADLVEMVMKESTESNKEPTYFPEKSESSKEDTKRTESESGTDLGYKTVRTEEDPEKDEPVRRMITAEYMQEQAQLKDRLGKLHNQMGQQERHATSISDQMQIETQELIALFGIPYVISPTEAESQCAFLDKACLTEGSITDDSDVWLFGGQRVYKNFFSQGEKHVELYQAADIQRVLNLNREKLIALAIMIGSDYSDGIQGVGPVLALEILSEFAQRNVESFQILVQFKEWWDEIQTKPLDFFSGSKLKEKLRKLKLRPGFPSEAVYDAFINPTIDTSTEPFKWGNPDLDAIRTYTKGKFGWEQAKCDSLLLPVLKKRQCELDQSRQLTLDSYISFGKLPSLSGGKRKKASKRVETAVKRLKLVGVEELNLSEDESDSDAVDTTPPPPPPRKQVTNQKAARKGKKKEAPEELSPKGNDSPRGSSSSPVKFTKQVIPQRVQAETDKLKNKQKAIEIFKQKGNRKK